MILDIAHNLTEILKKQFVTNHLEKKCDVMVVDVGSVGSRFKKAVEEEYNKTYLNDAEYIIGITQLNENTDDEEEKKDDENPEDKGEENKEEVNAGDEKKDDTKNQDAEKKDDEEEEYLDESIKIQDLTKGMLSTPKSSVKSMTKPCKCGKKVVAEKEDEKEEKKETKKSDPEKKDTEKKDTEENKKELAEAETEATGDKLTGKIQEAIRKALEIDENEKIQLDPLPGFASEGNEAFFIKVSFKAKKDKGEQEAI